MTIQSIKHLLKSDWEKIIKRICFLFMLLIIPATAKADLYFPSDPGKTANIFEFIFEIMGNFMTFIAVFYIIVNAFVFWLFVLLIKRTIKHSYRANPISKIKKSTYLHFASFGYFIDKFSFFIAYQILGSYTCVRIFTKTVCDYNFLNGFGENWVTVVSGSLIFIGMSILTYNLLSKKLYSEKKLRYVLSIAMGILANPFWIRVFFPVS